MNLAEKAELVRELIDAVRGEILTRLHAVPEEWDGEELRRYIADRFERKCNLLASGRVRATGSTKRLAAYRAAVAQRDL